MSRTPDYGSSFFIFFPTPLLVFEVQRHALRTKKLPKTKRAESNTIISNVPNRCTYALHFGGCERVYKCGRPLSCEGSCLS